MAKAMEAQGITLDYLGELARGQVFVHKAINKLSRMSMLGDLIPVERTTRMASLFAARIQEHLSKHPSDLVFSPSSLPIALLKTPLPKVFYTDATFAGILAKDPAFRSYPKRYIAQGHALEQAALDNCDLAIYASRWAARTAMEHYKVDERKVRVFPFGGNFTEVPPKEVVEQTIQQKGAHHCELLFVGVNWVNKGGPKVLEVGRILHDRGVPVRLHLVGSDPEVHPLPPYVHAYGFISKASSEGVHQLKTLFTQAHFLLLPTLADCLGLVLCEANAVGVPCMANDVGGVGEVVRPGINGYLFPEDAPASDWADRIESLFNDRQAYLAMARNSRLQYDERLNWGVAGRAIKEALLELV
jgi:glycosyltransferase involved in cell wall biosynthesis